jgi:hypothetical protein
MNSIPNEEFIHKMYGQIQSQREAKVRARMQRVNEPNPHGVFDGRQSYAGNLPRTNDPSFRSQYFNAGEGLTNIQAGETATLAMKTVPAFHAGVLTGFSQYFGDCDVGAGGDLENLVLWGLRINGLPPHGFMDFVGEFSSLMLPHSIYFPLAGGAATLGTVDASIGGSSVENIPTVILQATNYHNIPITLQGRLIGYTFPTAERNDEFANI